jgi:hypothetical protein
MKNSISIAIQLSSFLFLLIFAVTQAQAFDAQLWKGNVNVTVQPSTNFENRIADAMERMATVAEGSERTLRRVGVHTIKAQNMAVGRGDEFLDKIVWVLGGVMVLGWVIFYLLHRKNHKAINNRKKGQ